ncbi:MAG: hypothetical protein U1E14_20815 [Geminicoccaceae bacterium]
MRPSITRRHFCQAVGAAAALALPRAAGAAIDPLDPSYDYAWTLPFVPSEDSDVVVVSVPPEGITLTDLGSPSKILLLVGPSGPITGSITARFLRYRGVVMIGASFRPIGTGIQNTPLGTPAIGRNVLRISFDRRDTWNGHQPFIFLANMDMVSSQTKWGDFLRFGTARNTAGNNFHQWCRLYIQKIRIPFGHYGWHLNSENVTHSDFIQCSYGGHAGIRAYDIDVAWGYQTFFTAVLPPFLPHPTAVHKLRRIITRHMPDDPTIYRPNTNRVQFMLNVIRYVEDLDAGRYQTHRVHDWFIRPDPEGNSSTLSSFQLVGLNPEFAGDWLRFTHTPTANRLLPLLQGSFRLDDPPTDIAPAEQIGWQQRVTTAAELRQLQRIHLAAGKPIH